ncbi:MAG: SAF domain-containing protein, partial [Bacteroidota bacterium]
MYSSFLHIAPSDNVLVALRDLPPGEVLHFGEHDIV